MTNAEIAQKILDQAGIKALLGMQKMTKLERAKHQGYVEGLLAAHELVKSLESGKDQHAQRI